MRRVEHLGIAAPGAGVIPLKPSREAKQANWNETEIVLAGLPESSLPLREGPHGVVEQAQVQLRHTLTYVGAAQHRG